MNVIVLVNALDGVGYHRLVAPFMRMARTHDVKLIVEMNQAKKVEKGKYHDHLVTEIFDIDDNKVKIEDSVRYMIDPIHLIPDEILDEADVLVFNRNISPTLKPEFAFQRLRQHNVAIVCDTDDTPKLNNKHILKTAYRKMNMESCLFTNMLMSDVIWHTTPYLKKDVAQTLRVPKPYTHIKNAIDMEDGQWSEYDGKYEEGSIGWMGGVTHLEDLKMFKGGYEISSKPQLIIAGAKAGDQIWDKVIEEYDGLYARFVEPKNIVEYATLMYDFDVCIAPLLDNRFNRCKSELKMLEAAALGKPIIVSDVYPYKYLAENGVNCISVKNEPQSWADAIDKIFKGNYRQELAESLRAEVDKRYNIDKENEKRYESMKSIINKNGKSNK